MTPPIDKTVKWFRRFDLMLLVAVLAVVGGGWGFISLLDQVHEGETQHFDDAVLQTVGQYHGSKQVLDIARDITALGGVTVLTIFTLGVAGFLLISKKYHAIVLLLASTIGATVLTFALKEVIDRDRPDPEGQLAYVLTKSFPSGHAALSAAVYMTLGTLLARLTRSKWLKFYFVALAMLLSAAVGLSRIYLRVHWPTDVLAGWSLGLMWALLCWSVARWLQHRGKVEQAGYGEGEMTNDANRMTNQIRMTK